MWLERTESGWSYPAAGSRASSPTRPLYPDEISGGCVSNATSRARRPMGTPARVITPAAEVRKKARKRGPERATRRIAEGRFLSCSRVLSLRSWRRSLGLTVVVFIYISVPAAAGMT